MSSKSKIAKIFAVIFFTSLIGLIIFKGELKEYCLYSLAISGLIVNIIFLIIPKKSN
jgi:hypothetical protein